MRPFQAATGATSCGKWHWQVPSKILIAAVAQVPGVEERSLNIPDLQDVGLTNAEERAARMLNRDYGVPLTQAWQRMAAVGVATGVKVSYHVASL